MAESVIAGGKAKVAEEEEVAWNEVVTYLGEEEVQNGEGKAQTGEGEAQTGEEEAQTGEGEAQTGEEEVLKGEGEAQTGEEEVLKGEGEAQTGEEEVLMGEGEAQTGEEEAQTGEEEAQTGEEEAQTGEEEVQTGEEEAQLGEKETQIGEEEVQTGEGEVQTGEEETVLNRLTGEEEDIELATEIEENSDGDDDADFWMDERDFSLSEAETFLQVSKPKHKPIRRDSNDNWTIPDWVRKTRKAQMYQTLRSADPMTETEAQNVKDLWDPRLTLKDRVRLYLFWVQKHRPLLPQYLQTAREGYERQSQRRRDLKTAEEIEILSKAPVIGMTTTRAARYRQVLDKIACPIVILEEAAEVLEAHVVTTLHESCQHLILIGDHQQLRPSPTVYELCRHYQLDLSLFERLVNNKLPHSTLAVQHRMRPEVARLVRHIYPHLEDHEVTLDRPHIRGMKQDVFLFHHEATELTHSETSSKYNEHEAEMVMKLCRYLLLQDYAPHSITVLAAYTGQILKLKNIMQDRIFKDVLVTAVDNYQGEENDVIILSLVRSNVEGSVGFLGTDNRVCVALSRARNGLYAFGNFKILCERSKLWQKVVATAQEHGQLGKAIVLRCENHPAKQIHASRPTDFNGAPEGGCTLPCDARLECGHACRLTCHGYDRDHKRYKCKEKCERNICDKNLHPCPKECYETCGQCVVLVEKTVPQCGHEGMIACSTDPEQWICPLPCQEVLQCGHWCTRECGECWSRPTGVKRSRTNQEDKTALRERRSRLPAAKPATANRLSTPTRTVSRFRGAARTRADPGARSVAVLSSKTKTVPTEKDGNEKDQK
ncbi:hypothetical protein BaRGS_00010615 [Batillaria attramentaria]|uniref:NFX1-type zinc finger-containing protein 1 n=1 Tax=Batillaria attramentaria TaxID=370345 RepID=A0ABD0LG46_9CAEN